MISLCSMPALGKRDSVFLTCLGKRDPGFPLLAGGKRTQGAQKDRQRAGSFGTQPASEDSLGSVVF